MTPGDHVILINDDWSTIVNRHFHTLPITFPVKHVVYTIDELNTSKVTGRVYVSLCELPKERWFLNRRAMWDIRRFRKLDKLTVDDFKRTTIEVSV